MSATVEAIFFGTLWGLGISNTIMLVRLVAEVRALRDDVERSKR
jgi:hypothetical protein